MSDNNLNMISPNRDNITEIYLSKLHEDILVVMDEIHRVCSKNNIKYYLIGGTLLGAVRHNGFIPWDDDLDIAMPRDDMEHFFEVIRYELNDSFYLQWITTDETHTNIFPKLCLRNTLFQEDKNRKGNGIFVDIFPLDYCNGYSKSLNIRRTIVRKLNLLSLSKQSNLYSFKKILSFFISNKCIFALQRLLMISARGKGNTYFANFGSQYPLTKQTMPVGWFGNGKLVDFENRKYIAPIDHHNVLMSIFGEKYMEIPPVHKRRSHYPIKVQFADGTFIEFDEVKERVSIENQ